MGDSIQPTSSSSTPQHRRIYTVAELTKNIKSILEDNFPFVWICGEISNFRIPVSGHFYFTLKDKAAQLSAVMFKTQNRNLKFDPEDGLKVTGLGRISVYEPRGTYQIIFEYLEPEGIGAIQLAFEQLKTRLFEEGIFDEEHKNPLPFLPKKISVITSPSGAVVHDILKIIDRRFSSIHIEIVPVKVQGFGAEKEIVAALDMINTQSDADVAILARGGGSLEDFHAFNSEDVARAIFASTIPIVSAVGHETDFSISDFVADLRAPTPSAAAELVVPVKKELLQRCGEVSTNLVHRFYRYIENHQRHIVQMSKRLIDPRKRIEDFRLKTDDLTARMIRIFKNSIAQQRERLHFRTERLHVSSPQLQINKINGELEQNNDNLLIYMSIYLNNKRYLFREINAKLHALNPTAILERGYSIARTIPGAIVVRDPRAVDIGQDLEVTVAKGKLICRVKGK